ncbi:hypothetical protein ACFB49_26930 [Sphingomonas sp. DBB INV C78]
MAYEQNVTTIPPMTFDLTMNLGDERTDCIVHDKPARLRLFCDCGCHAVSGKEYDGASRDLIQLFDENCALRFQTPNHGKIVHDRPPDIDRGSMSVDSIGYRVDRAPHARAESSGRRQQQFDLGQSLLDGFCRCAVPVWWGGG